MLQVVDLQASLKEEQIIVEEKKATTQALIENIGKEKAVVDEAMETGREDEEAAAALQVKNSYRGWTLGTTPKMSQETESTDIRTLPLESFCVDV